MPLHLPTASRGFSATAEFLVLCTDDSVKSIIDQLINTDANLQTQVTTLVAENDIRPSVRLSHCGIVLKQCTCRQTLATFR